MLNLDRELTTAVAAVRLAARICQAVQAQITPDVMEKKDKSPVTIADFASQAVVCRALIEAFPQDVMIAEEDSAELRSGENCGFLDRIGAELSRVGVHASGDDICRWIDHGASGVAAAGQPGPSRFWTLDPIDGTKGFVRGEQYAIALALIIDGRIELAVLGCPNLPLSGGIECSKQTTGTLLSAVRGQGTFAASITDESRGGLRVQTSRATDRAALRLCESVESGHSAHDQSAVIATALGLVREPVRLDSQAKYAVVARGDADIYLRLPTKKDYREKIWDHAAGVLCVQEAGGRVTDVAGQPLDFTRGRELSNNRGVVVTSGPLHDEVIGAVRAAGVE